MNQTIMSKSDRYSGSVASDVTAEPKEAGNVARSESASEPKRDDGHEHEVLPPIVTAHIIKDSVAEDIQVKEYEDFHLMRFSRGRLKDHDNPNYQSESQDSDSEEETESVEEESDSFLDDPFSDEEEESDISDDDLTKDEEEKGSSDDESENLSDMCKSLSKDPQR